MRRRSLRLGITTLLSATLLGGATPAVAYEMQRDSATSLRIILDLSLIHISEPTRPY